MSVAPLLVSAAEAESSGVSPWLVGGGTLLLLLLVLAALLGFGGGRDHS
jgi:hypothetical protein